MADTHDELLARYEAARAAKDAAEEVTRRAGRVAAEAELAVLDYEDRPATELRRSWLRAWLRGDHAECERCLALQYPEQHWAATERAVEIAKELPARSSRTGLPQVNGATP